MPIAVNLETGEDASRAVFPAPRSWTQDRLRAWAAASTPMPTEDRRLTIRPGRGWHG